VTSLSLKTVINPACKICAKIIFSVPVSSAGTERLLARSARFSQNSERECCQGNEKVGTCGTRKSIQKWIERLAFSVSDEELKKGMELMGLQLKYWTNSWRGKMTLWAWLFVWLLFYFKAESLSHSSTINLYLMIIFTSSGPCICINYRSRFFGLVRYKRFIFRFSTCTFNASRK